jgi:hypothetical protein
MKDLGKVIFIMVLVLSFIVLVLLFPGCSAPGLDLTEKRTFVITKPPYQILVSGDLTEKDQISIRNIILDLSLTDFQDYKFNEKIIVTVLGSETDINNLHIESKQNVEETE